MNAFEFPDDYWIDMDEVLSISGVLQLSHGRKLSNGRFVYDYGLILTFKNGNTATVILVPVTKLIDRNLASYLVEETEARYLETAKNIHRMAVRTWRRLPAEPEQSQIEERLMHV